ncbi:MAG: hypothetical protein J6M95_03760 [Bacilli bacterium]|nr:hypothetical protein [Bacilli bacterium]
MKRDEFNDNRVNNEKGNSSFEFGNIQNVEYTFFSENKIKNKDASNDVNISSEYDNKEKNPASIKVSSTEVIKNGNILTGAKVTATTVIGSVAVVAVTAVSTIVGINLYYNTKCHVQYIESYANSIFYEIELSDVNNDQILVCLDSPLLGYSEYHETTEGINSGSFEELSPDTSYVLTVKDVTYNNYILYEKEITTLSANRLDVNIDEEAYFDDGVITLTLLYDTSVTSFSNVMLHLVDSNNEDHIYELALTDETQEVSVFDASGADMIELSDPLGFDYYVSYYFEQNELSSEMRHIVFTEKKIVGINEISFTNAISFDTLQSEVSMDYYDPNDQFTDFVLTISNDYGNAEFELEKAATSYITLSDPSGIIDVTSGEIFEYEITYLDLEFSTSERLSFTSSTVQFYDPNGESYIHGFEFISSNLDTKEVIVKFDALNETLLYENAYLELISYESNDAIGTYPLKFNNNPQIITYSNSADFSETHFYYSVHVNQYGEESVYKSGVIAFNYIQEAYFDGDYSMINEKIYQYDRETGYLMANLLFNDPNNDFGDIYLRYRESDSAESVDVLLNKVNGCQAVPTSIVVDATKVTDIYYSFVSKKDGKETILKELADPVSLQTSEELYGIRLESTLIDENNPVIDLTMVHSEGIGNSYSDVGLVIEGREETITLSIDLTSGNYSNGESQFTLNLSDSSIYQLGNKESLFEMLKTNFVNVGISYMISGTSDSNYVSYMSSIAFSII